MALPNGEDLKKADKVVHAHRRGIFKIEDRKTEPSIYQINGASDKWPF
jgi:hypothetical protein